MPIRGLTEQNRLPRIGKIHLGIKKTNARGVEYPTATDYFVCPAEVTAVYGNQPKTLDIIIPVEDDEMWCSQYYRQYSSTRGLVCKGDGYKCRRMVDMDTGDKANRSSKTVTWKEMECPGRNCGDYQSRYCQEVMNLQFLLPKVPGLGIWQIDTGSINSIRNINDFANMMRATCQHVGWVPLKLTLEPTPVVEPETGKKKNVHCLKLTYEGSLPQLLMAGEMPKHQVLIAAPSEEEAPMDVIEIEVVKPNLKQAAQDIEKLWPGEEGKPPDEVPTTDVVAGNTSPEGAEVDLSTLKFKTTTEFKVACTKYFNLYGDALDKEVALFDLKKASQVQLAWNQILAAGYPRIK